MADTPKPTNAQRLDDLLQPYAVNTAGLDAALKEIAEEEAAKKKEHIKGLAREAIKLKQDAAALDRKYQADKQRIDKALGKVVNRLGNMAAGKPDDEPAGEGEKKDDAG